MDRSTFFKRLGLGAIAVVVAPKVISEVVEEVKDESLIERMKPYVESQERFHKEFYTKARMSGKSINPASREHMEEWWKVNHDMAEKLTETFKDDSLTGFLRRIGGSDA